LRGGTEVEVRADAGLPAAASLDPLRATVIVLDRALMASPGAPGLAALAKRGDPGRGR